MTLQHRLSESLICSVDRNTLLTLRREEQAREKELVLYLHLMLLLKDRKFRSERHCAILIFA